MHSEITLARRLLIPFVIIVILLAISAFIISYAALLDLAIIAGIPFPELFPLIIDGLVVIATFAVLVLGKIMPKSTWYPWVTLGLFAALSIAGNGLHASTAADTTQISIPLAAAVSAIPPISLLLASHLLVMMMTATATKAAQRAKVAAAKPTITPAVNVVSITTAKPKSVPAQSTARINEAVVEKYLDTEAQGVKVTGAMVAEWSGGVSERTGRRILKTIQEQLQGETNVQLTN